MKRLALLLPLVCLVASGQIPPSVGTLVSTTVILDESQYVGHPCTLYAHNYQNPLTGHLLYCSAIGLNFNISVVGTWAILNTGGGGSVAWGSILGTLSSQTDLQAALNAKQDALTLPLSVANGGTGTTTPGLVAGTNVTITGSWPNQTINSNGAGSSAFNAITSGVNLGQAMTVGNGSVLSAIGTGEIYATNLARSPFSSLPTASVHPFESYLVTDNITATPCVITSLFCYSNGTGWFQVSAPSAGGSNGFQTATFASPPTATGAGNTYYDTSAANPGLPLYYSSGSGTGNWLQWLVAGPSGALVFSGNQADIDPLVICRSTNSCTWSALQTFTPGTKITPTVVGSLGTCNGGTEGRHWGVTDASTTIALGIGTTVAGGGANHVPVYCDGTNWVID